ncbi:MAG: MFS transporter [Thermodesulfobacteriota bacterium]
MANSNPPNGYLFSKPYTFYVFGLICLLMLFDFADRMIVASLFPFLKKEWGLTDTQCGSLVSAVYWAMFIFAIPISALVDRWSRRKVTGLMAVLWSVASGACAFVTGFWHLLAARTAIGVGEAAYAPAGIAMISALFPARMRSVMIGLFNAFIPIGMAVGMTLGGYIATRWGWRHAFGVVALPGLLVAIMFFFVREYKTVALEQTVAASASTPAGGTQKRKMTKGEILREFFQKPSLIACYLGFAAMSFQYVSTITFLPSYFVRIKGLPLPQATTLTSGILLVVLIANPLGGWLTDRWMKTNIRARMLFPALAYVGSSLLGIGAFTVFSTGINQYIALFGSTFLLAAAGAGPISVTQDVVHPGLRAMSYALGITFQHMLGSAPGPLVTGLISDRLGLPTAMAIASGVGIISATVLFFGSYYYKSDLDKVEKVELEAEAQ